MSLHSEPAVLAAMLFIALVLASPATALTPKRSPEQLAQDEMLFAQASQAITPQVKRCYVKPREQRKPIKVRFFVAGAGQRTAQFTILGSDAIWRPAKSRPERAAVRAISTCAPYTVPEELRGWGGFWATIELR